MGLCAGFVFMPNWFGFFCLLCVVGCRSYFCFIKNTLAKVVLIQQVGKYVKKAAIADRLYLVFTW